MGLPIGQFVGMIERRRAGIERAPLIGDPTASVGVIGWQHDRRGVALFHDATLVYRRRAVKMILRLSDFFIRVHYEVKCRSDDNQHECRRKSLAIIEKTEEVKEHSHAAE